MAASTQKLVIVESPAKAKTIEKFLGRGYKVEASQGHVRDLPKSQLGVDADNDFEMKYITIRGRGKILAKIKKEAKNASCIYLATDPDREGEAISWHLANTLEIDPAKPCRIEFHEITKKAVKEALEHPRPIDMDRVDAQQARRALDRLVGYKISPLLWAKVKKGLSAGRVQSVATRMVVEREQEIEAFIPEEFWDVTAQFAAQNQKGRKMTCEAKLVSLDGEKAAIHNEKDAMAAKRRILKSSFSIQAVKQGDKLKRPQPPFTTSSLQQEASRKLNFSTAKTMQVVQQLYEGIDLGKAGTVGLVTYIRTDSVRVADEAVQAARGFITAQFGEAYCPEQPNQYKGRKNAQDAHEAIRPTYVEQTPENVKPYLTREQFSLYRLIYTRFLASQMKPAEFQTMGMDIASKTVVMHYYGEHMTFPGYRAVYVESSDDEQEEPESVLPVFEEGAPISFASVEAEQHFTQPPARYTEASLVKALEEKGIGRPSTYAPTITTIISRGYVSREKKRLYPTELGRMVTSMMTEYFGPIVDIEFTASLEDKLDTVEEGNTDWHQILRDFYPSFQDMLAIAEEQIEKVEVKDEVSDVQCDKCGAMMVYKMGRFGRFLACPNFPECRNAKPILHYIDAPCPKCGARLMEKTSKKNRKFYGCEKYPECDFVSWERPIAEKCPKCGSYMVEKPGKRGETIHLCANETCRYKTAVAQQSSQEDE
ncbi:MAG: type I DNA topoisomerase [Clostridiales bacterium]|nr:type I DNA topoisomerase [Clostridiales bacterium]MDO4349972.1 type I DNA topoisomerase [Eubacteriales bacterium]MDY4009654.1 type I DNA topoisomerase [Candidatus Limiplasma sp.]